jgi:predicted RNA-binding protein with PUA-like domain
MRFIKKYLKPLHLAEIKADPAFSEFRLVRESRLSTMIVPETIAKKLTVLLDR